MNLYFSHWNKGEEVVPEQTLFFIQNFINCLKTHSANTNLVFLTDDQTIAAMPVGSLDGVEVRSVMNLFDALPEHKWPLAKMKAINLIEDDEVLHIDYDVVINRDVQDIIDVIRASGNDAVYQKIENLSLEYYSDYLKNVDGAKAIFRGVAGRRCAFNAGLVYYKSQEVKNKVAELLDFESDNVFRYYVLEQLLAPTMLRREGYSVGVLSEMVHKFKVQDVVEFPYYGNVLEENYKNLCKSGVFLPNIGFFHFLSKDLKEGANDSVIQVSNLQ